MRIDSVFDSNGDNKNSVSNNNDNNNIIVEILPIGPFDNAFMYLSKYDLETRRRPT